MVEKKSIGLNGAFFLIRQCVKTVVMKCGGFGFYDSPNEIKLCTAIAFLAFDARNNTGRHDERAKD